MNETSARRTLPSAPAEVRLKSWPIRDGGLRSALLPVGTVVVAVAGGLASQSVAMGLLTLAVLNAALWRLWIPVECTLGRHGVDQRGWFGTRRTPWTSVARYAARPGGLLLLPNTDPSPVAALRGLFIPWQDQRDAILAVVEFYVVPQAGPYESTVAAEHRSSVRRLER